MSKARGLADLGNAYSDGALSNRNLIINGAMQVAQRGTSLSLSNATEFLIDRYRTYKGHSATATVSQSSDAPAGFTKSWLVAVGTGAAAGSANELQLVQPIEGYNIAPLGLGTSGAVPFTISFWIKSSLTGFFGFGFQSRSAVDNYATTYSISSANTWEYKTVTIPAHTGGSWNTSNSHGLSVVFDLGSGSNYETTADTWGLGNKYTVSGTTKVAATSGATWQITGVQLEVGDTATPFEHRSYSDEIQRCSRYAHVLKPEQAYGRYRASYSDTGTSCNTFYEFPVEMRSLPTLTSNNMSASTFHCYSETDGTYKNPTSAFTLREGSKRHVYMSCNTATATAGAVGMWRWNNNPSASMVFDAEL